MAVDDLFVLVLGIFGLKLIRRVRWEETYEWRVLRKNADWDDIQLASVFLYQAGSCMPPIAHRTAHRNSSTKQSIEKQHQRPLEGNKEKPISFHAIFSSPNKNLTTMQCKGNPQIPTRTELFSTLHLIIFLDGI